MAFINLALAFICICVLLAAYSYIKYKATR